MVWRVTLWCTLFFLPILFPGQSYAQEPDTSGLRHYVGGEIVVGPGSVDDSFITPNTIQRVGLAAIHQSDAPSVDRVLRTVPGAHLQTNSRGETLVYLRGAGERQVAVFFDGALLNIPWDNRIDLSLVPAVAVGEITVAKGPPPVVYGTNVMGGALNLTSRSLNSPGRSADVRGTLGSHGEQQVSAYYLHRAKRLGVAFFGGLSSQDGVPLSGGESLPYNQNSTGPRTNTDRRLLSGLGQFTWSGDKGLQAGLSLLTVRGAKGIAPEGHHDPEMFRVRFWRYPSWNLISVILSGKLPVGSDGTTLRSAAWASFFGQTIDQYHSQLYENLDETQEDRDYTQGLRISLIHPIGNGSITGALSLLNSLHEQTDLVVGTGDRIDRSFQQQLYSAGAEYSRTGRVSVTLGMSLDGVATPNTGDKPPRDGELTYSLMSGLVTQPASGVTLRAAIGRKVRFPTMRELFGEALGRFLVNPGLGPENAILTEAGVIFERGSFTWEIIGFYNRTDDTIDQRLVAVKGEERPRRQRVNLSGSRASGVELMLRMGPVRRMQLHCNMMALSARAITPGGPRHLTEKPALLGRCASSFAHPGGMSLMLEYEVTGRAFGLSDFGTLARLPPANVINFRVGYLLLVNKQNRQNHWAAEAFARMNNATNTETLPQLGLPGPGRSFQAGMQLSF